MFVLWLISDHLTIRLSGMASKDQRHKYMIVIKHCNTWFINNVFCVISRSLLKPKLHHKVKILIQFSTGKKLVAFQCKHSVSIQLFILVAEKFPDPNIQLILTSFSTFSSVFRGVHPRPSFKRFVASEVAIRPGLYGN